MAISTLLDTRTGRRSVDSGPLWSDLGEARTIDDNRGSIRLSRLPAGIQKLLRGQRHLTPRWVVIAIENQLAELLKEAHLLCRRSPAGILWHRVPFRVPLHMEIAAIGHEMVLADMKVNFRPMEGKDEILDRRKTPVAADVAPLLVVGQERTKEAGAQPVIVEKFSGK